MLTIHHHGTTARARRDPHARMHRNNKTGG